MAFVFVDGTDSGEQGSRTVSDFDPAEDVIVFRHIGRDDPDGGTPADFSLISRRVTPDGDTELTYGDSVVLVEGVILTPDLHMYEAIDG